MAYNWYMSQNKNYNINNDEERIITMDLKQFKSYLQSIEKNYEPDLIPFNDLFLLACDYGLEEIMLHILKSYPDNYYSYSNGIIKLINNKHIELAKKIISSNLFNLNDDNLNYILRDIAGEGLIEFLKWMIGIIKHDKDKIFDCFLFACTSGHIDVAKFLLDYEPDIDLSYNNYGVFDSSCYENSVESLEWLKSVCEDKGMIFDSVINDCFTSAIKNKPVREWIISLNVNNSITAKTFYNAFYTACTHRELDLAQWIYSIYPNVDISAEDDQIFTRTVDIEICKWLLSIKPDINIRADDDLAFVRAYSEHNFEFADWLLSLDNSIDICAYNNSAFAWALRAHAYDQFEKLLSLKPHVDLTIDDHWIFQHLCNKGSVESVQYLMKLLPYQYKITIHESGEFIEEYEIINNLPCGIESTIIIPNELCCICMESMQNVQTKCSHNFCFNCLNKHYLKNKFCPICRTRITHCLSVDNIN